MDKEKTQAQLLQEKLINTPKSCYKEFADTVKAEIDPYIKGYISFMNSAKTEREFAAKICEILAKNGFAEFDSNTKYSPGDKVYFNNRKRSVMAAVIGKCPLEDGTKIIAAHIDSPRLDLKPNPMYEESELGYFKTHYYGGIKKYQWATIPLAIHGIIVKKDGEAVEISVGEEESDPVFCVTDILPHLAYNVQDKRTARDVIKGEELNVLLGSMPVDDEEIKEKVKLNLMRILNEKYGIYESDFNSAEIEIVPAFKARYVGFDKSLVGAYGHDDRVCSYAALTALLETAEPKQTAICVFADKEEIGSMGNTGLASDMLRNFLSRLCRSGDAAVETVCHNSYALSADVHAAFDPTFAEVMERRNASFLGYGPVITKYTGSGGKYNTSDASAEFMAQLRALFDDAGIPWQTGELGKVDEGGGGTVAKYIAQLDIEVVDIGVALLSMHSPFEIANTIDIIAMHKAFGAFIK